MGDTTLQGYSEEEIEIIARGLYWLANVDGIEDRELDVIREFLHDVGSSWTVEKIQATDFDPRELPVVLETSFLRRSFLKAAVALVAADGKITKRERQALKKCARLFGLSESDYQELEDEAQGHSEEIIEGEKKKKVQKVPSRTKKSTR